MEIWQIPGPWPGRLAVCARPRASWFLEDDVSALLDAGYTTLVSALTAEEVIRAELERVPAIARAAGLRFDHFPVGNLQVPDAASTALAVQRWRIELREGRGVAIHCWASVGRGPTLAAATLIAEGVAPEQAWREITAIRGREVPDTNEQRDWVRQFAPAASLPEAAS